MGSKQGYLRVWNQGNGEFVINAHTLIELNVVFHLDFSNELVKKRYTHMSLIYAGDVKLLFPCAVLFLEHFRFYKQEASTFFIQHTLFKVFSAVV